MSRPVTAIPQARASNHERAVISFVLGALTILSWVYMVAPGAGRGGAQVLMPCCDPRFAVAFPMWLLMMVGMMIPSVAPMVLTHAAIVRRRATAGGTLIASGLFLAGYLLAWAVFSAAAALAQGALQRGGILDGRSLAVGPWLGAAVLIAAGIFQLSPLKDLCLSRCRSPVGYFLTEWREGRAGAVTMGLRHGLFCVGCCWLLMAILFAVGIMNILWGVALTAIVLAEKVLPWRRAVVWSGGAICLAGAAVLLCRAAFAT